MKIPTGFKIVLAVFTALFSASNFAQAEQCCLAETGRVAVKAEIIASGLDTPWGFTFLPDGSVLVTEKAGRMRHIVQGKVSKALRGVPKVADIGQGGLLDVTLHPEFEKNQLIFFTYSQRNGGGYGVAIARAKLNLAKRRLENVTRIFTSNKTGNGGRHFGSRLRFALDGTLFATLGDRGTQMRAQDPFDHAGSVIRINEDGSVPDDNPFVTGGALPEIYSIGHRNAQGAAIHPQTGELWTLSHGAAGGDELNKPIAGKNYGWPLISYGANYSGAPFKMGAQAGGLEQPIYYWDPSIAPSGLEFYAPENALIAQWKGSLFVGALRGQHLSQLILNGDEVVGEARYFEGEFGRIRDVKTGPDGALYFITNGDDGKLVRVSAP